MSPRATNPLKASSLFPEGEDLVRLVDDALRRMNGEQLGRVADALRARERTQVTRVRPVPRVDYTNH